MKKQILETRSAPSPSRRKRRAVTAVGVALCVVLGGFGGFFLATSFSSKGVDYSTLDSDGYEDDVGRIYRDYLSAPKDPLQYSPSDLANIVIYKYGLEKYTSSDVVASAVSMGVTQKTVGRSIRSGSSFFNESLSQSSFVKVAKRFYQDEDMVDIYDGSIVSEDGRTSADYAFQEAVSLPDYEKTWGRTLDRPVIYTISSKTVKDTSTILKEGESYRIVLDLDPLTSVVRYVRQMTAMSDLDNSPEFTEVHVEFTVDADLTLRQMDVHESYYVWVFGKNFTESTLTETYTVHGEGVAIPAADEKTFY